MIQAEITIDLTNLADVLGIVRRDGNVDLVISTGECELTLIVKPDTLLGDDIIGVLPDAGRL
tara:strand:- start:5516 stop:5701 length:186 start_codon:yes stop_codon:yes gene_type:complete